MHIYNVRAALRDTFYGEPTILYGTPGEDARALAALSAGVTRLRAMNGRHYWYFFVKDIQTIPGYDVWVNSPNQRIMLDKDTLVDGNKHYSKNTCCFITHAESNQDVAKRHPDKIKKAQAAIKDNHSKKIYAINVTTNESILFNSQKEASRELGVLASHIWMILSEDPKYVSNKTVKDKNGTRWTFKVA